MYDDTRLSNHNEAVLKEKIKSEVASLYPEGLMLEFSSVCNLRCELCPAGSIGTGGQRGFMSGNLFNSIIQETVPFLYSGILINGQGEPLTDPDFIRKINVLKENNVAVRTLFTNGTLLKRFADEIVESGIINTIAIGIEGSTQETYERYRRGGRLCDITEGIKLINEKKRERNTKIPRIQINTVVLRSNESEIEHIREIAIQLDADFSLKSSWFVSAINGEVKIDSKTLEWLPEDRTIWAYPVKETENGDIVIDINHPSRYRGCHWQYRNTFIRYNGEVYTCDCDQTHRFLKMGQLNYPDTGIREIWNNEAYREHRRRINTDITSHPFCRVCPRFFGRVRFSKSKRR
ncbi:MAG: radical SAM protein [Deltaproteobacteria bacterium]|nr:radical SAM protein [Deltaproteobacteria bacterium]